MKLCKYYVILNPKQIISKEIVSVQELKQTLLKNKTNINTLCFMNDYVLSKTISTSHRSNPLSFM